VGRQRAREKVTHQLAPVAAPSGKVDAAAKSAAAAVTPTSIDDPVAPRCARCGRIGVVLTPAPVPTG